MTRPQTQKDPSNKAFWQKSMKSEFRKAALGLALIAGSATPFIAGMGDIWDMRAAVTAEQIATHQSYAASLKSCKNNTLPGKDAEILDCAAKKTNQKIISATPAFKSAMAVTIGGFTGMAGGFLWSVACAGTALDARRKYRGNTPA